MMRRSVQARVLALVLALLMTEPAWLMAATPGPELPDPGSVSMSREDQQKLGLQAAAEVYKQMPVLPDSSPVTQYVQQLGRKLERVIPQQYSWPFQFHVIPQKDINAFALPGGPIFVNLGTITAADNEAELAGVIAHEMSHVYMQHSAKQAPKQQWANILGALGGIFGGSTLGNLARLGIQVGAGAVLMKYSRGDEAQADAVGAIMMYKAGYNPRAMAEFFQKLEEQGGPGGPQFLSDHPNPGNRVAAVEKEIQNWPSRNYLAGSAEFASAKQEAAGMRAYTAQEIANGAKTGEWARRNQQNGSYPRGVSPTSSNTSPASNGNASLEDVSYSQIKPSGGFRRLEQRDFTLSYPQNWQAQNDQNGITIAPPAGAAQGSVAYGVVVSGGQDANATSLDQATQDLIANLQQSNPGLRSNGDMRRISVNGVSGRSIHLTGISPIQRGSQPVPEHDWLVTVPRSGGGLLYLIFIAPESDFRKLRSTYQQMLDSLQVN
ncbi:MAG TPA: M48 family metalloprotease [Terriglobales bacterium]|nr:M48 family metalloprotease [Terriglobales bacterium]